MASAHLQISNRVERWMVRLADLGLAAIRPLVIRSPPGGPLGPPRRVLLLRLERVGDLLMTLDAVAAVRALAPEATIDLVVGAWNAPLASLVPGIDRLEIMTVGWLARGKAREPVWRLARRAWAWRGRGYDLAINFEGDIRSHVLMGLAGARRRVGYDMAGGGAWLTDRLWFDAGVHTRTASLRLVERAFGLEADTLTRDWRLEADEPRLVVRPEAAARADALLGRRDPRRPVVAVHASGGRQVKQWHARRFAEVASRLARSHGVRVVLTGAAEDRPLVDEVKAAISTGTEILDIAGSADLVTLAAVLAHVDVLVTGDTGPMHLAAALRVPVVAVFGPSDPARWGPASDRARVVRVSLPCSPCNRIRRPPPACRGHVPACLDGVTADAVYDAAVALLARQDGSRTDG